MTTYRQPTVAEAVAVLSTASLDYRRACLSYWHEKYGEWFAEKVKGEFLKVWSKRREDAL